MVTIATNMAGRGTDIKLADGVADIGGLYIIGSERHESRRIDNQHVAQVDRETLVHPNFTLVLKMILCVYLAAIE